MARIILREGLEARETKGHGRRERGRLRKDNEEKLRPVCNLPLEAVTPSRPEVVDE